MSKPVSQALATKVSSANVKDRKRKKENVSTILDSVCAHVRVFHASPCATSAGPLAIPHVRCDLCDVEP